MERSYTFDKGLYFPLNFIFLGYFGMFAACVMIGMKFFLFGPLVLLASSFPVFLRHKVRLDINKKTIKSFNGYLGIEFGKDIRYKELKGIKVKKGIRSQTMFLMPLTNTVRSEMYYARLYFDKKSVLLKSHENKDRLMQEVQVIAEENNIPLVYS